MTKARKNKKGYFKTVASVAPVFAAKAAIGDFPKGVIESAVESKLKGRSVDRNMLSRAIKGKGAGRAVGGLAGVLTAPLFLKGVNLAGSKDKKERAKGLGLLAGATGAYSIQKGAFEGYAHARAKSAPKAQALLKGGALGLARASHKIPGAAALGLSLAAAQKSKRKKDDSGVAHHLIPAATGTVLGAGARGYESVAADMLRRGGPKGKAKLVQALRRAAPKIGGGAAGGFFGGLVLSGVVDAAKKAIKENRS